MTKVIFRVDAGECVAIFPEQPGDTSERCWSTKGVVNVPHFIRSTKKAEYKHYRDLADKLIQGGYDIQIVIKDTPAMREIREALLYM